MKPHAIAGVKTNVVTAVEIRGRTANDAPLFGPLVMAAAKNFRMKEVSADKAYLSEKNVAHAFAGANPFIPNKGNSVPEQGGL